MIRRLLRARPLRRALRARTHTHTHTHRALHASAAVLSAKGFALRKQPGERARGHSVAAGRPTGGACWVQGRRRLQLGYVVEGNGVILGFGLTAKFDLEFGLQRTRVSVN
eukprot:181753-Pyramimonas_sp.AAC.1